MVYFTIVHILSHFFFFFSGVRNYQIIDKSDLTSAIGMGSSSAKKTNESQLVEVGPRFVLIPIRIFNGSLGGPTLYQNPAFVSPNEERSAYKKKKGYVLVILVLPYFDSVD